MKVRIKFAIEVARSLFLLIGKFSQRFMILIHLETRNAHRERQAKRAISNGNSHAQRTICKIFINCFAFLINSTTNRIIWVLLAEHMG